MDNEKNEYAEAYSDTSYWQKLKGFAGKAGREVVERSLQLYYAAQGEDTPVWAKTVIYGALGYFISVIDAVPDITPIVGYTDDLGVLVAALAAVAVNITPEVKEQAKDKTVDWFGPQAEPQEIPEQDDSVVDEQ